MAGAFPANLNPARTGPSMFEPVHGAAHDIAGQGVASTDSLVEAIQLAAQIVERLKK